MPFVSSGFNSILAIFPRNEGKGPLIKRRLRSEYCNRERTSERASEKKKEREREGERAHVHGIFLIATIAARDRAIGNLRC